LGERVEKAVISDDLRAYWTLSPQQRAATPMDEEKRLKSFPRSEENESGLVPG
jgi:hypothetical protein